MSNTVSLSLLDGNDGFVIEGIAVDDQSGRAVSRAGDINGDGYDEVIIGAPDADPNGVFRAGESYIIFGKPSGFDTTFQLSSLDGNNGFIIEGIAMYDQSGTSVDGAGDVNADGYDDVIVGAPFADPNAMDNAGETYVLFGQAGGFNATITLSSLDGNNGFVLQGVNNNDYSGIAVSRAGDVNGDGIDDVIVGANSAGVAGESYVLFGRTGGFNATIALASLDGNNGFTIQGINASDNFGIAVSGAGDVNGDGYDDVIMSADYASPNTIIRAGENYIVFGQAKFDPTISLSLLDGDNGFAMQGINANDNSGRSVNQAGDINRDGFTDILIGASNASPNGMIYAGESYVVFGQRGRFTANLELYSLDGNNGFVIQGISNFDRSGLSVSSAGDFNGDGYDDVIVGAFGAVPNGFGVGSAGEAYVIFGREEKFNAILQLSTLDGYDGFTIQAADVDGYLGFSVSGMMDVNGDGFDDIIIGAHFSTTDSVEMGGKSYIIFGKNATPILINNSLTIIDGSTQTITSTDLSATDIDTADASLIFAMSNLMNGRFEDIANPGVGLTSFTQQQITNGEIVFLHVGEGAPSYDVRVGDGVSTSAFQSATVMFTSADDEAPIINNNNLIIRDGETTVLTTSNLSASDVDSDDTLVTYTVNNIQYGQFELTSIPAVSIFSFTQQQVIDNEIQFVHAGGGNAPQYCVTATDNNSNTSLLSSAEIIFNPIELNALDGNNGIVMQSVDPVAGHLINEAGDVNGDGIDDVTIGVYRIVPPPIERIAMESYVLFGQLGGFNSTIIPLSTLNGNDGFEVLGPENKPRGILSRAGDVNGDGIDDVIIGVPSDDENFVVFGQLGGFSATVSLSSLDGSDGFVIQDIDVDPGDVVSDAGDVNDDGYDDVIIGARLASPNGDFRAGESTVVFGQSNFNATLSLAMPDGVNGFVLQGISPFDESGVSVSRAGDIDDDEIDDVMIGAGFGGLGGDSYVLFGQASGFNATLPLSSLDGNNGVVMRGVSSLDYGGFSVSQAGDVNGDGYSDVIIGSFGADPNGKSRAGESYVVFGQASAFNAIVQLALLDGSDGFILQGINPGDNSGLSVNTAGDFNGDGFDDVIIGSDGAGVANEGQSYIVFGHSGVFNSEVTLSTLDGVNGFVIQGVRAGDVSGISVSGAGDVNGDGYDDVIIGAAGAGESYIVFGRSITPKLVNNTLTLDQGSTVLIDTNTLNATDFDSDDSMLIFNINNVQQGQFEFVSMQGMPITSFTLQQIMNSEIQFAHNDNGMAPNYDVTITDGFTTTAPNAASITFNARPIFQNNQLTLNEGETVILTSNELSATDADDIDNDEALLTFTVSNVAQGQFESTANSGVAITSFMQQNITDSRIQFVADASEIAPRYDVIVSDGVLSSASQAATVNFNILNSAPIVLGTIGDQLIDAGDQFSFTFAVNLFSDPDDDILTYSATEEGETLLPNWLSFNDINRTFSGTPAKRDAGNFDVQLIATDPGGASADTTFGISVVDSSEEDTSIFGDTATTIGASLAIGGGIGLAALIVVGGYGFFRYQKKRSVHSRRTDIELMKLVSDEQMKIASSLHVPETPSLAQW